MNVLPRHVSVRRAAGILRRVFGRVPTGLTFRLWDGTLVGLGGGEPVCTIVVRDPETFVHLMRDPTPLTFAEAYVDSALDVEGDLFAAMKIADAMEEIRLSTRDRLHILVDLWRP